MVSKRNFELAKEAASIAARASSKMDEHWNYCAKMGVHMDAVLDAMNRAKDKRMSDTPINIDNWPLVVLRDDGIRRAGKPDACSYCRQTMGSPHGRECVIVNKRVEHRITATLPSGVYTGLWQFDEPHHWTVSDSEFHKNGSSWCANNYLGCAHNQTTTWLTADPTVELIAMSEASYGDEPGSCLCNALTSEFVRVVDDTPRRKINTEAEVLEQARLCAEWEAKKKNRGRGARSSRSRK